MENSSNFNRKRRKRLRVCHFCVDKIDHVDYKEVEKLRNMLQNAVRSCRAVTGTCAKHQRQLTKGQ